MEFTSRAQLLLGTLVSIHVADEPMAIAHPNTNKGGRISNNITAAIESAFKVVAHIGRVMSAHQNESDLGRLSRALPNSQVIVDPETIAVLKLAKYWYSESQGAFDPVISASKLRRAGMQPGLCIQPLGTKNHLHSLSILSNHMVHAAYPVQLDFGGIAKGYAVDRCIETLRSFGIQCALVNAGGDMRAIGEKNWRVINQLEDAHGKTRFLKNLSLASSEGKSSIAKYRDYSEFVHTKRNRRNSSPWRACSVVAPNCVTADVFTKWGLQTATKAPVLQRSLAKHHAQLWRA